MVLNMRNKENYINFFMDILTANKSIPVEITILPSIDIDSIYNFIQQI